MNIEEISKEINANAHEKGFWDKGLDVPKMLALIHSEVSEALEADRKDDRFPRNYLGGDASETKRFLPEFKDDNDFKVDFEISTKNTLEDELADAAIRIFDLALEMNIDLPWHIKQKVRYNTGRPKMHGGKKY
jgi:NTP pyrophosphatase (non-canonical NTP hydrolase)